jgi:hypothetical protein
VDRTVFLHLTELQTDFLFSTLHPPLPPLLFTALFEAIWSICGSWDRPKLAAVISLINETSAAFADTYEFFCFCFEQVRPQYYSLYLTY